MASIDKLPSGKWRASIYRRKGPDGKAFRQSYTDNRRSVVKAWADELEAKISKPGGLEHYLESKNRPTHTVGDLVARYKAETTETYGETKANNMSLIQRLPFSKRNPEDLLIQDWLGFAKDLHDAGKAPATVASYYSTIAEIMRLTPAWGLNVDLSAMDSARKAANKLGYLGKSDGRNIRPSLEQLDEILHYSTDQLRARRDSCPLLYIVPFAIFSGRRQSEIVRITWEDVEDGLVFVRNMKHPRKKNYNARLWLTEEALHFAEAYRQFRELPKSGRIFPFHKDTVGRKFTEAVATLDLGDLHFHDLRHEACSRLGELGYTPHQIMKLSGHVTSQQVDRYTHLRANGDQYEDWPWFEKLSPK